MDRSKEDIFKDAVGYESQYDFYKNIGKNIKKARLNSNMTQEELGKKIGQTPSSINHYEKPVRKIPVFVLDKIAIALNVPIGYLLLK